MPTVHVTNKSERKLHFEGLKVVPFPSQASFKVDFLFGELHSSLDLDASNFENKIGLIKLLISLLWFFIR